MQLVIGVLLYYSTCTSHEGHMQVYHCSSYFLQVTSQFSISLLSGYAPSIAVFPNFDIIVLLLYECNV